MRTCEPLASTTGVSSDSQRVRRGDVRSVGGSRSFTERDLGGLSE
jgi:hypothetical protein